MAQLRLVAGGFTPEDFARFIHVRMGDGEPVYWYGVGDAATFPGARVFMRVEGCDMGRLHAFDRARHTATALTRKMMVLRDPVSGEIMTGPDGKPAWVSHFTYQLFRFRLEDGFLAYEVDYGAGKLRGTVTGGPGRS
jgi:hypothetical protein